MWTTDRHDVRPVPTVPAAVAGVVDDVVGTPADVAGAPADEVGAPTDGEGARASGEGAPDGRMVVGAGSADDDLEPSIRAPTIVSTTTSAAGMASARGVMDGGRYIHVDDRAVDDRSTSDARSTTDARRNDGMDVLAEAADDLRLVCGREVRGGLVGGH